MIDTHAHVNFAAFKSDFDEVMKRAIKKNIVVINVGSQYTTSQRAVKMTEKFENTYAAVALHPVHIKERKIFEEVDKDEKVEMISRAEQFDYDKYFQLAKSSSKVVAIGETGLDYFHLEDDDRDEQIEKQKILFRQHIDLANDLDLPMIIHCREAYDELLVELKAKPAQKKGIIHSFLGAIEQANEFIDMGYYIGVNGIITFKKAEDLVEVIKKVPADKIVTETDCPYLTPVPFRGKRNEPAYVEYVLEKIAEIKGMPIKEFAQIVDHNARKLFQI